jgi:probable rRNA maturation factor
MSFEYGDLVICLPVVLREAAEQAKLPGHHLAHLVVHGTLHLLGYTHDGREDAARMEALETRILAGLGIADPYVRN